MGFMSDNKSTGSVIKYVDNYLYTNINNLYEKGLLKDTIIFFFSQHGLHISTVYPILAPENYFHERSLCYMFIFMDKKDNFNDEELIKNQQKLITAYDIYETLYHIVYGDNYIRQENSEVLQYLEILLLLIELVVLILKFIQVIANVFPQKNKK